MAAQRTTRRTTKNSIRRDEHNNGEISTDDNQRTDVQRESNPGTSESVENVMTSGLDEFVKHSSDSVAENKDIVDGNDLDMSLFGNADASEFSDNPFEVAPGTYWAALIEATPKKNEDGNISLKMVWQIEESDNEYEGNKVTKYQTIINKKQSDMSPDEKRSMKFWKLSLRRGFDLSEDQMNSLKISDLLGRKAFITTTNNTSDGITYTNINKITCKRIHDEETKAINEDVTNGGFGI